MRAAFGCEHIWLTPNTQFGAMSLFAGALSGQDVTQCAQILNRTYQLAIFAGLCRENAINMPHENDTFSTFQLFNGWV